MSKTSIAAKVAAMAEGETIIIPSQDYRVTMRSIGSSQTRGHIPRAITCQKAHIIIGEEHRIAWFNPKQGGKLLPSRHNIRG